MKRFGKAVAVAAAVLVFFAGCASNSGMDSGADSGKKSEKKAKKSKDGKKKGGFDSEAFNVTVEYTNGKTDVIENVAVKAGKPTVVVSECMN